MTARGGSTFVTAVGWTFTVLGALLLCIALVQNLVFAVLKPFEADLAEWEVFPPASRWIIVNLRALLLANLVLGIATIAASIGLVQRREWARISFVALMAIGVAWNVAVAWVQFDFMSALQAKLFADGQPDTGFSAFLIGVRIASFAFAASFCTLFGWIGLRLLQPEVATEFSP